MHTSIRSLGLTYVCDVYYLWYYLCDARGSSLWGIEGGGGRALSFGLRALRHVMSSAFSSMVSPMSDTKTEERRRLLHSVTLDALDLICDDGICDVM